MDDTLEISAIHEAAHGVVKWRLACDLYGAISDAGFDLIVLRTADELAAGPYIDAQGRAHHCSGISEMSCFYSAVGPLDDAVPDFAAISARRKMGHDIMVMLAGPLAEARVCGCAVELLFERPHAGYQDWQRALQTIMRLNLKAEEHAALIADLRAQTEAYLSDPAIWRTIGALAQALLAQPSRRLTGELALPIMQQAWVEPHRA